MRGFGLGLDRRNRRGVQRPQPGRKPSVGDFPDQLERRPGRGGPRHPPTPLRRRHRRRRPWTAAGGGPAADRRRARPAWWRAAILQRRPRRPEKRRHRLGSAPTRPWSEDQPRADTKGRETEGLDPPAEHASKGSRRACKHRQASLSTSGSAASTARRHGRLQHGFSMAFSPAFSAIMSAVRPSVATAVSPAPASSSACARSSGVVHRPRSPHSPSPRRDRLA